MRDVRGLGALLGALLLVVGMGEAAQPGADSSAAEAAAAEAGASWVPDVSELMSTGSSGLRDVVARFTNDRQLLLRRHDVTHSRDRRDALRSFYLQWQSALEGVDFSELGIDGRIDDLLLGNKIGYELRVLDRQEKLLAETSALVPFLDDVTGLEVARRRFEHPDAQQTAALLAEIREAVQQTRKGVEVGLAAKDAADGEGKPAGDDDAVTPIVAGRTVAYRASKIVGDLQDTLKGWYTFYDGYDPLFTWWVAKPYERLAKELADYRTMLREKIVGFKEGEDAPIVGDPIGRDALMADLAYEMIPYTPEQLIAIADQQFAWCEREMLKASRELGYGDDWKQALEHVKQQHVQPGEQPDLVRDLEREAVAFLKANHLITVPELADDTWRMEMLSPERQKESPFFLGGEVMMVSYPTDAMTEADKLMSMRGNNRHFARATVFHEMIPGHRLQMFMLPRYASYRMEFDTPFWIEGWALYWEMRMWDLGFAKSPEDRIGMLFWRMHRCARIIFSLRFHLGEMTPEQCIDFLVDRVGHERANATAEVRRSFEGSYPPLYQLAYMIGGLQFRALHDEVVGSGRMTERQFHDTILKMGTMPVEMVRARLTNQDLTADFQTHWKSAGDVAAGAH